MTIRFVIRLGIRLRVRLVAAFEAGDHLADVMCGLALRHAQKCLFGRGRRDACQLADRGEAQLAVAEQLGDARQVEELARDAQPLVGRMRSVVELALHVLDHRRVAESAVEERLLGFHETARLLRFERHATLRERTQPVMQRFPVGIYVDFDRSTVEHREAPLAREDAHRISTTRVLDALRCHRRASECTLPKSSPQPYERRACVIDAILDEDSAMRSDWSAKLRPKSVNRDLANKF